MGSLGRSFYNDNDIIWSKSLAGKGSSAYIRILQNSVFRTADFMGDPEKRPNRITELPFNSVYDHGLIFSWITGNQSRGNGTDCKGILKCNEESCKFLY